MDWKDIGATVAKFAPMVGGLLGGPAGGVVGSLVASAFGVEATPDAVSSALVANPEAAGKLREIESHQRVRLQELLMQQAQAEMTAATAQAQAINETMRAEAGAEHWPSYSWRPFLGFCVGFNIIASSVLVLLVFVPVMFGNKEAATAIAQLPMVLGALAGINATVLPILGVASWFRGKAQADPNTPVPGPGMKG
jgi:roadblock/LC7 domain-containing protein